MPEDQLAAFLSAALSADPAISLETLQISASKGVVTVTGAVDDRFAANRAVAIARSVRGVRAIVDRIDVRSFPRADATLESAVSATLRADPVAASQPVSVHAQNGVVTLSGTVDSQAARMAAKDDALAMPGVLQVVDGLSDGPTRRPDAHIEDEVLRAIHDDPWMAATGLFVWVDRGAVHLSGRVANVAQLQRAARDARLAAVAVADVSGVHVDGNVEPAGGRRSEVPVFLDAELAETLRVAFAMDPRVHPFAPTIDVHQGIVVIGGSAPSQDAARAAEEDAGNVVGAVGATDLVTVASLEKTEPAVHQALSGLGNETLAPPPAGPGATNMQPARAPAVPRPIAEAHDQAVALYSEARSRRWADANERLEHLSVSLRRIGELTVSNSANVARLAELEGSLTDAVKANDRTATMAQANELSAVLSDLAAPYTPGISAEVHRLDFYGRALQIAEETGNPREVRPLVDALKARWDKIRPQLASRDEDDAILLDAAMVRLEKANSQPELTRATSAELEAAHAVSHALQR